MRRHGAAAQIIAIGEAAGKHDQIGLRQFRVAMPDFQRLLARRAMQRVEHIVLAIGAGENDDGGLHEDQITRDVVGIKRERCMSIAAPFDKLRVRRYHWADGMRAGRCHPRTLAFILTRSSQGTAPRELQRPEPTAQLRLR